MAYDTHDARQILYFMTKSSILRLDPWNHNLNFIFVYYIILKKNYIVLNKKKNPRYLYFLNILFFNKNKHKRIIYIA